MASAAECRRKSMMNNDDPLYSPFYQKVQHLLRRGKSSIGGEEYVDIGRFDLAGIRGGQIFHQTAQCSTFYKANPHGLPFQMRNAIVRIL